VRRHAKAPSAEPIVSGGSGAPSLGLAPLLALAAIAALALALASSASAHLTRPYLSSFPTTSPAGLGVDQQNGDIYALDTSNGVVRRYDTSGAAKNFTAGPDSGTNTLGGSSPFTFFGAPVGAVAVDRSGGLSDGNIYVADFGPSFTGEVRVFSNDGTPLTTLTGSGTPAGAFAVGLWLGVDQSTGDLYVGDANDFSNGRVWRYSPSSGTVAEGDYSGGIAAAGPLCGVAAAQGHVYTADICNSGEVRSYAASDFATGPPPSPSSTLIDTGVTALAADPSTGDLYIDKGDSVSVFDSGGASLYSFGSPSDFGSSFGVAVKDGGGDAYVSDPAAGEIDVFGPPIVLPDVTTDAATAIAHTTATLNGTVNPDGVQLTDCHFEYTDQANFQANGFVNATDAPCNPDAASIPADSSDHAVSADIGGLTADTTYHVRLVATNANGTATGGDQTFTTPQALVVTTGAATDVQATTATLNGTVNPLGVQLSDCHFEYTDQANFQANGFVNATDAPCNPDAASIPADSSDHAVSADIGGLTADTTYHVRLVATNSNGTVPGADQTFTTLAALLVTTGDATDVQPMTATLNGTVNPLGVEVTDCHFDYGTDTSYGQTAPCAETVGSGTSDVAVHADLTALDPNTTYHFRLVATNSNGTVQGADAAFTTFGPPEAITLPAGPLTPTTAVLGGQVDPNRTATTYYVEYSTQADFSTSTSLPASQDADAGSGDVPVAASRLATDLTPDTDYFFRLVATNAFGTDQGQALSFHTLAAPGPPPACPNAALRTGPSANLPDCRAYELVTPPDMHGIPPLTGISGSARRNFFDAPATPPDGSSLLFGTAGQTLPGIDGSGSFDVYKAKRGPDGWLTSLAAPTSAQAQAPNPGGTSPDLLYSTTYVNGDVDQGTLAVHPGDDNYLRAPDGSFTLIGQGSLGVDPAAQARWITPNAGHVIFDNAAPTASSPAKVQLEPDAPPTGTRTLYDRSPGGPTHVVSLLPGNLTPAAGQNAIYRGASQDGSAVAFEISDGSTLGDAYAPTYVRLDNTTTDLAAAANDVPVGRALTCTSDPSLAATTDFQWLRDGAPIPGETDPAYTTVGADDGAVIQCQVTALNPNAGSTQVSSPGVVVGDLPAVLPPVPGFISAPGASATLSVGGGGGQTLTCDNGSGFSGSPTFAFQWYRNGVALSGNGADTDTYTVPAADLATAAVFQCALTATNAGGSVTKVSPNLATSPAPDPPAPNPNRVDFSSVDADVAFAGLSADGDQLFYASGNPSCTFFCPVPPADLFSFDTDSQATTQIASGGGARFVNVSADGSRVYFTSTRQLDGASGIPGVDNLYLWDRATDQTHFIAVLDPADVSGASDEFNLVNWVRGAAQHDGAGTDPSRTTPDGSVLLFESRAQLTSYDNQGHVEVYRYSAQDDSLTCVSCNPTGAAPLGDAHLQAISSAPTVERSLIPSLTPGGHLVAFQTDDALLPQDTNGKRDVYTWHDGRLALISTGHSPYDSYLFAITPDGHDVFFITNQELVPQDHNGGASTIYDARIDGGFPPDLPPPSCVGDTCQGAPSPPPTEPTPGSSGFTGPGNQGTKHGTKRCGKHKTLKHDKCVSKKHSRRANTTRGGGK
jgi:phosphodiesterase/alkaline phosphatase D-like protein